MKTEIEHRENMNWVVSHLKDYEFYFAGSQANLQALPGTKDLFGKSIHIFDPSKFQNGQFFDLLNQLDGLSYGEKGIPMDKWVALDCGMLPSGFFGFAKQADKCSKDILSKFKLNGKYNGLVPITEYCAIPSAVPGHWIGHTLATLEKGNKLGLLTKVLGLMLINPKTYSGIAQYDNCAIKTHSAIADLEITSAITSAHSLPQMTFMYTHPVSLAGLEKVLTSTPQIKRPSVLLDPFVMSQKEKIQEVVESGKKCSIIYPGQVIKEEKLYIPILFSPQ